MLLAAIAVAVAVTALFGLRRMQRRVEESARMVTATARAGVLMARALNALDTLSDVVHVLVPDVADWAVIHLVEDHGGVSRAAIAHRDPDIQSQIEHIQQLFTFNANIDSGPARVIRTGESTFTPRVSRERIAGITEQYAQYGSVLTELIDGSLMSVPLRGREKTIGA